MSNKNKHRDGVVYSTDPGFRYVNRESPNNDETLPPQQQLLRVRRDSKMRAGKTVTIVENFVGTEEDLDKLGKLLKSKCGVGGTVKDGVILIQGEFIDRIMQILTEAGYKVKRAGG